MRRAAQWDGAFPVDRDGGVDAMMSVEATAEMIAFVQKHHTTSGPFDFVHAGLLTGTPSVDRQTAQRYAST